MRSFRGSIFAGRPEAIYCIERLVDKCARELGIAPDEIRRRNFIQPEQLPYTTALGDVLDSGEFTAIMEAGMARADWADFAGRRDASVGAGKLRGIGMATYVETCGGGFPETADVKFDTENDHITIYIGTVTNGQLGIREDLLGCLGLSKASCFAGFFYFVRCWRVHWPNLARLERQLRGILVSPTDSA